MSTSPALDPLRRASPKAPLDAEIDAVLARIDRTRLPVRPRHRRRRLVPALAAAALVAGGAALVLSTTGSRGTVDAVAAVRKAARVTAASAERSGTAVVRMTHDGQPWAGKTVRWNGDESQSPRTSGDAGSFASSTGRSTSPTRRAAAGSTLEARRTSTRAAARRPTSTSPRCVRTSAGRPSGGSSAA